MLREARKLQVCEIVVSMFEMDQNWNLFDPKKVVPILLLSGISNTSIFKVRDVYTE